MTIGFLAVTLVQRSARRKTTGCRTGQILLKKIASVVHMHGPSSVISKNVMPAVVQCPQFPFQRLL